VIPSEVVLNGTLKPDGTLELDSRPALALGRVVVTVRAAVQPPSASGRGWWEVAQRIWAEQAASGHCPRSKEQVDADLAALRGELDHHLEELEQIRKPARPDRHDQDRSPC